MRRTKSKIRKEILAAKMFSAARESVFFHLDRGDEAAADEVVRQKKKKWLRTKSFSDKKAYDGARSARKALDRASSEIKTFSSDAVSAPKEDGRLTKGRKFKKIVCVMAVYGRVGITVQTLRYLMEQSYPISEFVIVGSSDVERDICLLASKFLKAEQKINYIETNNRPLSNKWQAGLYAASKIENIDGILICGSDNWLSRDWVKDLMPYIDKGYALAGRNKFYVCSLNNQHSIGSVLGRQYTPSRKDTPIGSGRIYSSKFLKSINWRLYPDGKNRGLDGACQKKVVEHNASVKVDNNIGRSVVLAIKGPWDVITKFENFENKKHRSLSTHSHGLEHDFEKWFSQNFEEGFDRLADALELDRVNRRLRKSKSSFEATYSKQGD